MVFHVCYVILGICTEISRELLPFPIPVGILYLWVHIEDIVRVISQRPKLSGFNIIQRFNII